MEYSDFDRRIMTQNDLEHYKKIFEKDIQDRRQKLDSFIQRGIERLEWIQTCEKNKEYRIFGGMHKHGRQKEILCIVRYPDGTQRDERYSFSKISDAREKLKELRDKYSDVDWSAFTEEF